MKAIKGYDDLRSKVIDANHGLEDVGHKLHKAGVRF